MSDLATAAEVAAAIRALQGAVSHSGGWERMACPAHNGTGQNLAIRDGDDGMLVAVCHSRGCKYQDILQALQEATGLRLLREKGGGGRRPRKVKRVQPATPTPKQQAAQVKQQQDEAEKQRLCDELRRASSKGPFGDDHPSMRYLLTREAHACWASGDPLPVPYVPVDRLPGDLRYLVKGGKGKGGVGCLLGSFRLKPGGDPKGVQRVILNDQGLPVNKLSKGKQEGVIWLNGDDPACSGSLYLAEGILDAIRVQHLLGTHSRVACTAGSLKNLVGKVEGLLPTLQQFDRIVLIPDGDNVGHKGAVAAYVSMRAAGIKAVEVIAIPNSEDPASVSTDWIQGRLLDDPEPIQEAVDPVMAEVESDPDPEPVPVDTDTQEQEIPSSSCSAQWQAVDPEGLSWRDGVRVPGRHRCGSCYRLSTELRLVLVGDDQQGVGWCPWCIQQGSIQYVAQPAAYTQQGVC